MQNPNGLRVLLLAAPAIFLVLPLSTLVFILERISRTFLNTHLARDWRSGYRTLALPTPSNTSSSFSNAVDVRVDINEAPTLAILGVSVWAFVAGVLACCGIWELRRVEGSPASQRFWAWTTYITNLITVGFGVGVLAWASAVQNDERWDGTGPTGDNDVRTRELTRETIVCTVHSVFPGLGWAGPACGLARATRFMVIALVVAAVLVMGSAGVLTRDRGGVRWLFGGKGRYAGFASVYEMGPPPAQPVPLQFQPMPQQYPGPQQYGYGYGPGYQVPQPVYVPAQFQPGPVAAKDPTAVDQAMYR